MNDDFSKLIVSQLGKIFDKQTEQGERLMRIETNHENLNGMLGRLDTQLKSIGEIDERQTIEIRSVGSKVQHIEDVVNRLTEEQELLDSRIMLLESMDNSGTEVVKEKVKVLYSIGKSPYFKWGLLFVATLLAALVSGRTDLISTLIEKFLN